MSQQTTNVKSWLFVKPSYPDTLYQGMCEVPSTPPNATSVIIKPHAVSLNPVDIQLMNLPFSYIPSWVPFLGQFASPKIAGRDFSGTVLAAGPSAGFKPGDEITGINMAMPGTGFLAEAVCLDLAPGSGATVVKKPSHLSHVQASSLPCVFLTAKTSVEKCAPYMRHATAADNKLVVLGGSSATGIYTVKLAKAHGWTVLSSCSHRNTDFVRSLGADKLVDYTTSETAVVDAVRAFQPHAIIDCVGGVDTIGLASKYITIVGDKTSRSGMGGPMLYFVRPRMPARWLWGYLGLGPSYECIVLASSREYLADIENLSADEIIIDSVYDFDHVKDGFERLNTARARGKVVVKIIDE